MPLLNIYFPSHWWDISLLVLVILILPVIIRQGLMSMKKAIDLPYVMVLLLLLVVTIIWFLIAKGVPGIIGFVKGIDLSGISKWVWIGLGALVVTLLIIKFRPRSYGRLYGIDKKTGAVAVVVPGRNGGPFWIMFLAGIIITALCIFIFGGWYKVFRWENQTASIEEIVKKIPKVKMESDNDFEPGDIQSYEIEKFGPKQFEIPRGESVGDTITLNFTGPSGQWSRSVWFKNGTLYYRVVKERTDFVPGIHTIRTDKACKLFITNYKPRIQEVK